MPELSKSECSKQRACVWLAILFLSLCDSLGSVYTGVIPQFDWAIGKVIIYIGVLLFLSFLLHLYSLRQHQIIYDVPAKAFEAIAQSLLIICLGFFLAYIACSLSRYYPYQDAILLKIDQRIGFDWYACMAWFNQYPQVSLLVGKIYESFMIQLLIAISIFSLMQRPERIYRLLFAIILSIIICITISIFYPATSIYAYKNIDIASYANIPMKAGFNHIGHLTELRKGTLRTISFGDMRGLITFPSFHASSAILLIWAFWEIKWLNLPLTLLNLLMLISVPIIGGHYLIDAIAGVVIAMVALYISALCNTRHLIYEGR